MSNKLAVALRSLFSWLAKKSNSSISRRTYQLTHSLSSHVAKKYRRNVEHHMRKFSEQHRDKKLVSCVS